MRSVKFTFLALLILSLIFFISGCGPTNQEPNASFNANPTIGEAPLEVNFDASGSSDPDGSIIDYAWNFDDGSTSSGKTTTHTFDSAGGYTVELTVTDGEGAFDSTTKTISVSPPPNVSPEASFSTNPTSGKAPLEVSFDASGSSDPDGSIYSYSWDFGDGSTGSGESTNHTFDNPGDYTVELTVTDNEGATDSTSKTISASTQSNQPPTANFTANPTSGEVPLEVFFDASGSLDSDGSISSYKWDFEAGDYDEGPTGSGETISHTFDKIGTYEVELTVTDNDGAKDTATTTISVEGKAVEILNWELTERAPDNSLIDSAKVEGSIKNISNQKIAISKVSATFYNSNDEDLGTYADLPGSIESGETVEFEVLSAIEYDKVERVELDTTVYFDSE